MKNKILKFITWVNGISFILGACAIDSEGTNVPYWMCVIPLIWFLLFLSANNWFQEEGEEYQ